MLLIFASSLSHAGQKEEAKTQLLELAQRFPAHQDIVLNAVNIYMQKKELPKAIAAIDKLINSSTRRSNIHAFHFLKDQE